MHIRLSVSICALVGCMSIAHAETIELRLTDQFPLTHYASVKTILPFIKEVEEASKGRIKIKHFPAQQLNKAKGMLDAVRTGVADLGLQVAGYVSDRLPLTSVIELPGLFPNIGKCYEKFQRLADTELFQHEYKPLGVRAIEVNCTPPLLVLTRAENVNGMDKLKGLKLRSPTSGSTLTLQQIGAVPINLPAPDTYLGIQRGTLDGAILSPSSALGYHLQTLIKGAAKNVNFGSTAAILFMNEKKFQSLPKDLQAIIVKAGRDVGRDVAVEYDHNTASSLKKMAATGTKVYDFSPDVTRAIVKAQGVAAKEWETQMKARGLPGEKILAEAKK